MSDLNWCTYCDNAINTFSNSLYCSEDCLRSDALSHHPLLGYDYAELKHFPRTSSATSPTSPTSPTLTASSSSTASLSPSLSPISSFKEVPVFQLNPSNNPYQHFYQQKQQTKSNQPVLLSSPSSSTWIKNIL